MVVLLAAFSAALPTDAGRFTERELHAPNEDSLLHPAFVGQVQLPSDATACCLCRVGERWFVGGRFRGHSTHRPTRGN